MQYGKDYTLGSFRCRLCCRNFKSDHDLQEHYRNSPQHPSCGCCGLGYPDDVALEVCQLSTYISRVANVAEQHTAFQTLYCSCGAKVLRLTRTPTTCPRRLIQAAGSQSVGVFHFATTVTCARYDHYKHSDILLMPRTAQQTCPQGPYLHDSILPESRPVLECPRT